MRRMYKKVVMLNPFLSACQKLFTLILMLLIILLVLENVILEIQEQ